MTQGSPVGRDTIGHLRESLIKVSQSSSREQVVRDGRCVARSVWDSQTCKAQLALNGAGLRCVCARVTRPPRVTLPIAALEY